MKETTPGVRRRVARADLAIAATLRPGRKCNQGAARGTDMSVIAGSGRVAAALPGI